MSVAISTHKQAVKAAIALMVGTRGHTARYTAMAVQEAQEKLGLEPGDLASMHAKANYAAGVLRAGEHASNRKWDSYPSPVAELARRIADTGEAEMGEGVYFA